MSKENWTPGPWRWGNGWTSGSTDKYMDFRLLGARGEEIIPIRVDHHEPIWDSDPLDTLAGMTSDADRYLIRSAPDLYEALFNLCKFCDEAAADAFDDGETEAARLALAKARGETNQQEND